MTEPLETAKDAPLLERKEVVAVTFCSERKEEKGTDVILIQDEDEPLLKENKQVRRPKCDLPLADSRSS